MNILKNNILRNFIYLTGSNIIAKLIGFMTTIIVARIFSVEDYGIYKWYSTIIGYLLLLINFGFDVYFFKLIFDKKLFYEQILAIQLKSRIFFGIILYLFSIFIAVYFIEISRNEILFIILSFQLILYIFNIDVIFKIKEKFKFLSFLTIIQSLFNLLLVILFVQSSSNIIYLSIVVVSVNLFSIIISWVFLKINTIVEFNKIIRFYKKFNFSYILTHLKKSIVINLSFFMISIYYSLDSLMLGIFSTKSDVAIYSVAYAFILMAIMPTGMLYNAFSPKLSKNKYNKKTFFEYIISTTLLGIVIFIFLLLTYKYLILYTYGEKYLSSVEVLFYLTFNIIPCYLAGAFANPINLWGDYKKYLFIVSTGAIGNFVGNLIFIPLFGIKGAIFTTILSEVLVFLFAFIYWVKHKELLK